MNVTFYLRSFLLAAALLKSGAGATYAQILPPQVFVDAPNPAQAIKKGELAQAARQAQALAAAGDAEGQFMLALFFWHGVSLPQSFQDALNWITLAAVSGHKRAPDARLTMLKSVEPSLSQRSMEWTRVNLTQRAEAGDNEALFRLAVSYSVRFGFESAIDAYFWYNLSASSGNVGARKLRNDLIAKLKPADVIKAQERAKDWFDKWRNSSFPTTPEAAVSERMIDQDDEQSADPLAVIGIERERERGASDQSVQGGSVEQR